METEKADAAAARPSLMALFQQHMFAEFGAKNVEAALSSMTDDPYVINVPVLTGGIGKEGVREFYAQGLIPQTPPDFEMAVLSVTEDQNRLVVEGIAKMTHTLEMDWFLPGVSPTGKVLEFPLVAIIEFRDGLIAGERLYWDQASVLLQAGLLPSSTLPVLGAEVAQKLLNPVAPLKTWPTTRTVSR